MKKLDSLNACIWLAYPIQKCLVTKDIETHFLRSRTFMFGLDIHHLRSDQFEKKTRQTI